MVPVCFGAMPPLCLAPLRFSSPDLPCPILTYLYLPCPYLTWVYRWYDMR